MHKANIAICIGDREYAARLTSCLMKHYRDRFLLHLYDDMDSLCQSGDAFDLYLFSDQPDGTARIAQKGLTPALYLRDGAEESLPPEEEGIAPVEKFQEANRIVDEILSHIPEDVCRVITQNSLPAGTRILGVYSLSMPQYQLPFAVTLGSILGEEKRVLLVDLQENSGLSRLGERSGSMGLEELFLMADGGEVNDGRITSCIGHLQGMDYVFPVENAECLCEAPAAVYQGLIGILAAKLDYEVIILNLGVRFQGFGDILGVCAGIYFLKGQDGPGKWREQEFAEELDRREHRQLKERLLPIELSAMSFPAQTFERLIEQWKWNELGDLIRRTAAGQGLG